MLPVLILLLVPLALGVAAFTLRRRWLALRGASSHHARIYWACSLAGHLLFAYAMLILALLAVDRIDGSGERLVSWWPSLLRRLGVKGEPEFMLLLDAACVLALALACLAVARGFGHVDESGAWRPALRAQRGDAAFHGDKSAPPRQT